jgi:hypothetical protein
LVDAVESLDGSQRIIIDLQDSGSEKLAGIFATLEAQRNKRKLKK